MDDPGRVRLDLLAPVRPAAATARLADRARDGTLTIGVGIVFVGAFLGGVARWPPRLDGGLWVSIAAVLLGTGLLIAGYLQQQAARRRVAVGIAVTAFDPHGSAEGRDLIEQAETFCRSRCESTFTVLADLTGDSATDVAVLEQFVDRASEAVRLANRLRPEAARTMLVPIMRLHVAFWFGARLGRSQVRPIALYTPGGTGTGDRYFLATVLSRPGATRPGSQRSGDLLVAEPVPLAGGDPTRAALAVDVLGLGDDFIVPVREECQRAGVGWLLYLRAVQTLRPNTATWSAVVDQVEREWRASLPKPARTGWYAVFLDSTAAVAVALGARLASTQPARWTAYTLDRAGGQRMYEPFPPVARQDDAGRMPPTT